VHAATGIGWGDAFVLRPGFLTGFDGGCRFLLCFETRGVKTRGVEMRDAGVRC